MGIIATVGIAIIFGWNNRCPAPEIERIAVEIKNMSSGNSYDFNITVYDINGKPVEGAELHLVGCGIDMKKITDKNGSARFLITPQLQPGVHRGEIKVTATFMGKTLTDIIYVHD
ncbi:MAG: hypothetical protein QW620_02580 [Thermoplasmata archaeon]